MKDKHLAMAKELEHAFSEAELIDQICTGKKDFFRVLIEPYQRTVFSLAYSLLGNAADAEEVAQEVFLKAFRGLAAFRAEAKFSTWLIQIALNESRARRRRDAPHLCQPEGAPSLSENADYVPRDLADWREIPSEALALQELRGTIQRALDCLEPMYREVLVLRDLQHLSTAQTAEALSISDDLARTRLRRARLQMREALAPGYDGNWTVRSKEYRSVRPW